MKFPLAAFFDEFILRKNFGNLQMDSLPHQKNQAESAYSPTMITLLQNHVSEVTLIFLGSRKEMPEVLIRLVVFDVWAQMGFFSFLPTPHLTAIFRILGN